MVGHGVSNDVIISLGLLDLDDFIGCRGLWTKGELTQ